MGEMVSVAKQYEELQEELQSAAVIASLDRVLPPNTVSAQRLVGVVLGQVRIKPALIKSCSRASLKNAILRAAFYGVEPDGTHAYLIPYGKEATYQMGYQGVVLMAYRNDRILTVKSDVVHEFDEFKIDLASDGPPTHIPGIPERGAPIGAWATVRVCGAGAAASVTDHISRWMSAGEIEEHRDKYVKGWQSSDMWTKGWKAAWRKTVALQALRFAPKTIESMRLFAGMDSGVPQSVQDSVDLDLDAMKDVTPDEPAPEAPADGE